jgi:hypothetical protein
MQPVSGNANGRDAIGVPPVFTLREPPRTREGVRGVPLRRHAAIGLSGTCAASYIMWTPFFPGP